MTPKNVFLLRHGATGRQGRYIGSSDIPLSEEGVEQTDRTARLLRQEGIARILCSPMLRCRETRDRLRLSCPCDTHGVLREVDFGRWEGKSFAEIATSDAQLVASWVREPHIFRFPEGESLAGFHERVTACHDLILATTDQRLLVVTHGGVIRHLLCLMLGLPSEKYLVFDVQPGSFCSLQVYSDGSILTGFNIKG